MKKHTQWNANYADAEQSFLADVFWHLMHGTGGLKMRDIVFRGKRVDNGEWVYGYLSKSRALDGKLKPCIDFEDKVVMCSSIVIPETVGQYTGLRDHNGTRIFEWDIVKCTDKLNDYDFTAVVVFGNPNGQYDWGFQLKRINGVKANTDILLWVETEESGAFIEVIGNIHDNPELLEELHE